MLHPPHCPASPPELPFFLHRRTGFGTSTFHMPGFEAKHQMCSVPLPRLAHLQERLGYQRPSVSPECSATCVDIRSMAVSQSVYPDAALCVCDLNTINAVNDAFGVAIALFPGVLVGISLMYGAATLQVQRLNIDYGHASKERDVLLRLRSDAEAPGGFAPPVPSPGTRPQGNLKGAPGRR